MNNKFFTSAILLIVAASIVVVFMSGEAQRIKSQSGYSLVFFENAQMDNFNIVLENQEKSENNYQLTYLIDGQEVAKLSKTIPPDTRQTIAFPDQVRSIIEKQTSGKLGIRVNWEDKEQEIWKLFR